MGVEAQGGRGGVQPKAGTGEAGPGVEAEPVSTANSSPPVSGVRRGRAAGLHRGPLLFEARRPPHPNPPTILDPRKLLRAAKPLGGVMSLEVYPAMEVNLPHVPGGKRNRAVEDGVGEAQRLLEQHERLYVVDRRGLQKNRGDVVFLQEASAFGEVWSDAGPRYEEDIMDLLIAGASHVVVRWHTLDAREELERAAAISPHLSLALEFRGKDLVQNPREPGVTVKDLTRWAREHDVGIVVVGLPDEADRIRPQDHAARVRGLTKHLHYLGPVQGAAERGNLEQMGYDGLFTSTRIGGGEGEVVG